MPPPRRRRHRAATRGVRRRLRRLRVLRHHRARARSKRHSSSCSHRRLIRLTHAVSSWTEAYCTPRRSNRSLSPPSSVPVTPSSPLPTPARASPTTLALERRVRDRATRDDPPLSLHPAAAAAGQRGSPSSNPAIKLLRTLPPTSRPNRSTNAPTSPLVHSISLASTSLSLATTPGALTPALSSRARSSRSETESAIASSSARTSSPLSARRPRARLLSLGVADVGRVVLPLSTSSSSVASVARVDDVASPRGDDENEATTSRDDDDGTARRDAMRRTNEWMNGCATDATVSRCALSK